MNPELDTTIAASPPQPITNGRYIHPSQSIWKERSKHTIHKGISTGGTSENPLPASCFGGIAFLVGVSCEIACPASTMMNRSDKNMFTAIFKAKSAASM